MAYSRDEILDTHKDYEQNYAHWEFYIRSYNVGHDYKV